MVSHGSPFRKFTKSGQLPNLAQHAHIYLSMIRYWNRKGDWTSRPLNNSDPDQLGHNPITAEREGGGQGAVSECDPGLYMMGF